MLATAPSKRREGRMRHLIGTVRRAFSEFLAIPSAVIFGFLLLAGVAIWLDSLRLQRGWPSILPGSHESIQTLLGTVATSIITVTSITFSLLLVAVQQGASALTSQVYDQFLRRRANQVFFGFFVGLALFCLVTLAAVHPHYTPVYGAILAFLLTVAALCLLIILIYSTVDQMRPVMIVKSIREHAVRAREFQSGLLRDTRPALHNGLQAGHVRRLRSVQSGFLTDINVPALRSACRDRLGAVGVVIVHSVGDYISRGEDVLELHFTVEGSAENEDEALKALRFDDQRDLATDPAYGVEQLTTIGWTSTSTAKSNPQPGVLAVLNMRDLVGEWYGSGAEGPERSTDDFPGVYTDKVPATLFRGFESIAVVASESMQHQTLATVYAALEFCVKHVPLHCVADVEDIIRRTLSALGDHVLTHELQQALARLANALEDRGREPTAEEVRKACNILHRSIGAIHSRGTRAPAPTEC